MRPVPGSGILVVPANGSGFAGPMTDSGRDQDLVIKEGFCRNAQMR